MPYVGLHLDSHAMIARLSEERGETLLLLTLEMKSRGPAAAEPQRNVKAFTGDSLRQEGHRTLVFALYMKVLDIMGRILDNGGFKILDTNQPTGCSDQTVGFQPNRPGDKLQQHLAAAAGISRPDQSQSRLGASPVSFKCTVTKPNRVQTPLSNNGKTQRTEPARQRHTALMQWKQKPLHIRSDPPPPRGIKAAGTGGSADGKGWKDVPREMGNRITGSVFQFEQILFMRDGLEEELTGFTGAFL
eukprot:superscaffoldBa00003780_g17661